MAVFGLATFGIVYICLEPRYVIGRFAGLLAGRFGWILLLVLSLMVVTRLVATLNWTLGRQLEAVGAFALLGLAAVAALAEEPSRFRGIGHLRGHETDRLEALSTEINRLGGNVRAKANSLRIVPAPLTGADIEGAAAMIAMDTRPPSAAPVALAMTASTVVTAKTVRSVAPSA